LRIAYAMPMRPLGQGQPSGDLHLGTGLAEFLHGRGHEVIPAARLSTRFIYWRPWRWPALLAEAGRSLDIARGADLWLTYHAYYKAPDLIGPWVSRKLNLPYVILQGAYATKHRKRLKSWPGFVLNRRSLNAADLVIANKHRDHENLGRLLPPERLAYVPAGIRCADFRFDAAARARLRREWNVGETPVVLAVAMFRADVKRISLIFLIESLGILARQGVPFTLVLAGDGPARAELETLAARLLPGHARFLGKVARERLFEVYSAADVFAFPGVNEALGLVYLEAQACGLPVVAFKGWGVAEAVAGNETGLLTPPGDQAAYAAAVARLLAAPEERRALGRAGRERVLTGFDLDKNLLRVEDLLLAVRERHAAGWAGS
jgi:glycosyltransferase involved in cell wall biosynthesis